LPFMGNGNSSKLRRRLRRVNESCTESELEEA